MFKNLKIAAKLWLGFGVLGVALILVSVYAYISISSISADADKAIKLGGIVEEMLQREVDHLKWAEEVTELVNDEDIHELSVQTDDRLCGFGKWYYGAGRKEAEEMLPEIKGDLRDIEEPHRILHDTAVEIKKAYKPADLFLNEFITQKENDHLKWVNRIYRAFVANENDLKVQMDPSLCGFGLWLKGEHALNAAKNDPEMKRLLDEIKVPHAALHRSAKKIQKLLQTGKPEDRKKAFEIFSSETLSVLAETQAYLKKIKDNGKKMIAGVKKSIEILHTKVHPTLEEIQGILKKIREKAEDKSHKVNKEIEANAKLVKLSMVIVSVLGLVLGIVFAAIIALAIVKPLRKAMGMAENIREGDLSQRLKLEQKDEIGQLSNAFDSMADSLEAKATIAENIADCDLTVDVKLASDRDTLGHSLDRMVRDLREMITQINEAVSQVAAGSGEISEASQSLSQGATESAASLEEITSSMTEISSQTKTNAENANQANQLTNSARSEAERGGQDIQGMLQAMADIGESSQQIAKIIKTIDDIAFQTNILALNAAVEAARAGQHGKGFAVVADEVRNLAGRSAKAARETAELIESAGLKVENGQKVAQSTSESFSRVVDNIMKVADLSGEIAAASNEQAQGMSQMSQGLSQIDMVTQQNTANAEETASSAEELSSQAALMKEMMSKFKLRTSSSSARAGSPPKRQAPDNSAHLPPNVSGAPEGWGNVNPKPSLKKQIASNEEIISLEDNEFGRY